MIGVADNLKIHGFVRVMGVRSEGVPTATGKPQTFFFI